MSSLVAPVADPGPHTALAHAPNLSVVVAARNEAANLAPLLEEVQRTLEGRTSYEIVVVDDGSDDASPAVLETLRARHPNLRVLRHATACGQSAAMRTGIRAARGRLVATMDGDGQNDPADIPKLLEAYEAGGATVGLAIGWRTERHDTWSKRRASRIANGIRSRVLGDGTPDTGCGLKLFARETFLALPYFDHMHRFLPALVRREGLSSLSVPVNHRPRRSGRSNYGNWQRALVGIVDMLGVLWLQRRRRLPAGMPTRNAEPPQ